MRGHVRITQLDGKLPNLALMRLSAWHRSQGDEVYFTRSPHRHLYEPEYTAVYGSAIFKFSEDRIAKFLAEFPGALIGGTGTDSRATVEQIVPSQFMELDYNLYLHETSADAQLDREVATALLSQQSEINRLREQTIDECIAIITKLRDDGFHSDEWKGTLNCAIEKIRARAALPKAST